MDDVALNVKGIKELRAALRSMDGDLPKQLRVEFLAVSSAVAGKIAGAVPHRTGRAAASVKPRATQSGAAIAFGGSKAPYMPWLDFGGSTGPGHRPGQAGSGAIRRPWLGRPVGEGRYVYPTIRRERPETMRRVDAAVAKVAAAAGFDTTGSSV